MSFIEKLFEALGAIYDDENDSRDDVIKLRGLELENEVICLEVESIRHELDFFPRISLTEDKEIQIEGFDCYLVVTPDFGSPSDTAYNILRSISFTVEAEEDDLEE